MTDTQRLMFEVRGYCFTGPSIKSKMNDLIDAALFTDKERLMSRIYLMNRVYNRSHRWIAGTLEMKYDYALKLSNSCQAYMLRHLDFKEQLLSIKKQLITRP